MAARGRKACLRRNLVLLPANWFRLQAPPSPKPEKSKFTEPLQQFSLLACSSGLGCPVLVETCTLQQPRRLALKTHVLRLLLQRNYALQGYWDMFSPRASGQASVNPRHAALTPSELSTFSSKPEAFRDQTLNPKPQTLNPKP